MGYTVRRSCAQVTKRLAAFCEARVPPAVRNTVRLGFRVKGGEVVLFEERPAFQRPEEWREMVVAKFRCVRALPAAPTFKKPLDEGAADPTGIFWG